MNIVSARCYTGASKAGSALVVDIFCGREIGCIERLVVDGGPLGVDTHGSLQAFGAGDHIGAERIS